MKIYIIVSLLLIVINAADSAQQQASSRRNDKSKLAVMLAYKPKSEIQTKDENDRSWTYKINNEKQQEEDEELNNKLMELLTKEKFAKYFYDKATVKRENNHKRNAALPCDLDESDENIDGAKIVEVNKQEKKSCYKDTYKNVLSAFEEALKSQIKDYKKCVCQKKQQQQQPTTSTTTTTTSTSTTTEEPIYDDFGISNRAFGKDDDEDEDPIRIKSKNELDAAADHPNDIICFHKQYALMLNKLLDRIPCERKSHVASPSSIEEYNGDENTRNERHNVPHSLESIELDVSKITQKPTVREKTFKATDDDDDELREQILAVLKEHLNSKKVAATTTQRTTTTTTTTTDASVNEVSDEDVDNEDKFLEKLRKLFQQLESDEQESFPVSTARSHAKSTTSLPTRKSTLTKSNAKNVNVENDFKQRRKVSNSLDDLRRKSRKSTVSEDSDESTEISIKLKNSKFERQHPKSKENIRENANKKISTSTSYRTASRSKAAADSDEKDSHSNESYEEEKEAKTSTENSSSHDDDRLANDLAKAISDFARKYIKS